MVGGWLVFYANAIPDVWKLRYMDIRIIICTGTTVAQHKVAHPLRPFCQDLEDMVFSLGHDVKYIGNKIAWHALMKQIAIVADEYLAGFGPVQRLVEAIRVAFHLFKWPVVAWQVLQAYPVAFCVAVCATGTDFGTAGDRVPCFVGPFDV